MQTCPLHKLIHCIIINIWVFLFSNICLYRYFACQSSGGPLESDVIKPMLFKTHENMLLIGFR